MTSLSPYVYTQLQMTIFIIQIQPLQNWTFHKNNRRFHTYVDNVFFWKIWIFLQQNNNIQARSTCTKSINEEQSTLTLTLYTHTTVTHAVQTLITYFVIKLCFMIELRTQIFAHDLLTAAASVMASFNVPPSQ